MKSGGTKIRAIDYQRCLITYLDVLGTRQLLNESSKSTSRRAHIHSLLSTLIRETSPRTKQFGDTIRSPGSKVFVRTFSDLVVRFTLLSGENAIESEVWNICEIQNKLFTEGVLIRGAITIGDLFWDAKVLFGPGLVRAYELEHHLAVYPRVVVDQLVLMEEPGCSYVRSDSDGVWFLDYLNRGIFAMHNPHYKEHEFFLNGKKTIEHALNSSTQLDSISVKYMWLAKYFNNAIEMKNDFFRSKIKVKSIAL